jgi:hypothetical protein
MSRRQGRRVLGCPQSWFESGGEKKNSCICLVIDLPEYGIFKQLFCNIGIAAGNAVYFLVYLL